MDSFEIVITPDAEADLLEIRDYIAYTLLVPDAALDYIRAIRREIEKLRLFMMEKTIRLRRLASSVDPDYAEWRRLGICDRLTLITSETPAL